MVVLRLYSASEFMDDLSQQVWRRLLQRSSWLEKFRKSSISYVRHILLIASECRPTVNSSLIFSLYLVVVLYAAAGYQKIISPRWPLAHVSPLWLDESSQVSVYFFYYRIYYLSFFLFMSAHVCVCVLIVYVFVSLCMCVCVCVFECVFVYVFVLVCVCM